MTTISESILSLIHIWTVLDLVIDDEEDGLDDEERALLHSHIGASADQMKGKQGRPIVDVLADLRTGR